MDPTFDSGPLAELARLRRLEVASAVEAVTLLLLVAVAVPLKHLAGWALGVRIMGPVHGLAFVTYAWLVVRILGEGGGRRSEMLKLCVVAMIPFGGFFNMRRIERRMASVRSGASA